MSPAAGSDDVVGSLAPKPAHEPGWRVPWRALAPWLVVLAAVLWMLRDTAAGMVAIWWRAGTYTHAFLVVPVVIWLVWRQRDRLVGIPVRPVPWMLLAAAALCLGWLLGDTVSVGAAAHFALVGLIAVSVPAVLGWAVTRQVAFPLLFLFFAVPFGDFTAPKLMAWTADFTVLALRATGIPVYQEGMNFVIPSGSWSVVEACSGVRYLIASVMVGTLFAYLNYRTLKRRVIFVLVSAIVPLVANWLRAYMIVMIGHLSGNRLAVGVDHLIYGWVFFGIVVALLYVIGARWAEHGEANPPARRDETGQVRRFKGRTWAVVAGFAGLLVATQVWSAHLASRAVLLPALSALPAAGSWQVGHEPLPWSPGFLGPRSQQSLSYVRADGRRAWIWVGVYGQESDDSTLVSSENRLVKGGDHSWQQTNWGQRAATAELPALLTGQLRDGRPLVKDDAQRLLVWQVYRIGDRWVAGAAEAKLWQAFDRLRGRADANAVVLFVTTAGDDASRVLEDLAQTYLNQVGAMLDAVPVKRRGGRDGLPGPAA